MNNLKIGILKGGKNEEHQISLLTAEEVKKAVLELDHKPILVSVDPINFHEKIKELEFDICFNALHGPFGEDGKVQKILFDNNIKFSHSGINASKIAFNKNLTKKNIKNSDINYPNSISIDISVLKKKELLDALNDFGKLVLKPVASGSSYGVQLIESKKEVEIFFQKISVQKNIYKNHNQLILEPFINGKELTVTVLEDNNQSKAIEVTEIESSSPIFNYKAKYTKGFSKHICPAKIPKSIYQECLINAKKVHDILGCRGISRSDFLYNEESNKVYFLEINTQPGLTPVSLVPEQLLYNNIDFITLIDKLIKASSCQD